MLSDMLKSSVQTGVSVSWVMSSLTVVKNKSIKWSILCLALFTLWFHLHAPGDNLQTFKSNELLLWSLLTKCSHTTSCTISKPLYLLCSHYKSVYGFEILLYCNRKKEAFLVVSGSSQGFIIGSLNRDLDQDYCFVALVVKKCYTNKNYCELIQIQHRQFSLVMSWVYGTS